MDKNTARILIDANNRFYGQQAIAFGKTRNNKWPGWERIAALLPKQQGQSLSALDVACGNFRFQAFLERTFPDTTFSFRTVDNAPFTACQELRNPVSHQQLDVLEALLEERQPAFSPTPCQLTTSFGFMHHIPGQEMRMALLDALAEHTQPEGLVALSFWRFLDNPQLARQAQDAWEPACQALGEHGLDPALLDRGDAFLGWDGKPNAWRYCHSFCSEEIDRLVCHAKREFVLVDRFRADGRDQSLNEYLVLRKL